MEPARRTPVPTRRLVLLAGGLLALALATPVAPGLRGPWWALSGLVLLLAVADAAARPPRGLFRVARSAAAADHVGRSGAWRLEVEVEAAAELRVGVRVVVRDTPPPGLEGDGVRLERRLSAGERLAVDVPFRALARGPQPLGPVFVRVEGPLGLLAWQDQAAAPAQVVVLPGRPTGEGQWLVSRALALAEAGPRPHRKLGADWELDHLREWVPGDEPRRIAWAASARRLRPVVAEHRLERRSDLLLVLDCGRLMGALVRGVAKLDLALTPLLDVAAVALARGERVGLLAFDAVPRAYLPPRAGPAQLHAIREALGRLPAAEHPTGWGRAVAHLDARQRKRCLLVLFSDFTDEASAQDVERHVASLARRHAVLFVAVSDPHLEEVLRADDDGPRAAFQQAVAGQLLVERARALRRLERLGVPTVDAEPAKLTAPVLARYLEQRRRGVG